jgi:molybdopterin-guanine dinucleotide biosynthesis protein A
LAPKGLATVGGVRVIDRVAAALREASEDLLLVANDADADAWLPGVTRIADVRRGLGPLGGVHAALAHSASAILVVAWDMPFVPSALLTHLRRLGAADTMAVVPESADGRLEPTCAFYARECIEALEGWLDSGRSGAAAFLGSLTGVRRVAAAEVSRFGDPARLFLSVNTPAALRQADALAALT